MKTNKGFAPIILLIIVLVVATATIAINKEKKIEKEIITPQTAKTGYEKNQPDISTVEQELISALKVSSGISPETYAYIDKQLTEFERAGIDTKNGRSLLSQFKIGDQTETIKSIETTQTSKIQENNQLQQTPVTQNQNENTTIPENTKPEIQSLTTWTYENEKWTPSKTPPACSELILESPIDISKVTSILYPGQTRGPSINDYKAHGGFRFDNTTNNSVEVRSPLDGYVWRGARFYVNGEIQYGFDIVTECGIMQRFGHLYELSPKFQELASKMRPAVEGDSRTTDLIPYQKISKGELIATKIGLPGNIGMDWGVYDLRKENDASKDPNFREKHFFQRWYDYHGICWLDLLTADQKSTAKSLPGGDGVMGKTSDYCK